MTTVELEKQHYRRAWAGVTRTQLKSNLLALNTAAARRNFAELQVLVKPGEQSHKFGETISYVLNQAVQAKCTDSPLYAGGLVQILKDVFPAGLVQHRITAAGLNQLGN